MRRKNKIAAGLIAAGAAVLFFAAYSINAIMVMDSEKVALKRMPVVVIDPGHGGLDGGATGVGGVVEKDINLAIAKNLYDMFVINGFEAVLTRDKDISLHDESATTVRQKKSSDLHHRMDIAKSYPDAILLSIHQNKYLRAKPFGAQIFYGPEHPESQAFALIMQRRFIEMLQPENTRKAKPCGDSVYLIHHAPMPALLIECGFLSNPRDAANLSDPEYQRQVAFVIFASTMEYLGLEHTAEE